MTTDFSCHDKARLDDTARFCEEVKAPSVIPSLWTNVTADYAPIYALIREVPKGEVASYGMIASLLPGAGPRQVARAMRFAPKKLPWFRIITSSGAMADHAGAEKQRRLLKKEGVVFRKNGAVDWKTCRWRGPSQKWIDANGMDIETAMEIIASWR